MSVRRVAQPCKQPLFQGPRISFVFSESMLSQTTHTAPGQHIVPPLQNLSLKTAPTAAISAPNRQFRVWINVMRYVDMSGGRGPNAGRGTYARELYNKYNTSAQRPSDDDLILWMQVDGMPTDRERLRYAALMRNMFTLALKGKFGATNAEAPFDETLVVSNLTPLDAPINKVDQCDPWLTSTTHVWRVSTDQQKNNMRQLIGKPTYAQLTSDVLQSGKAMSHFGNWLFKGTPNDGIGTAAPAAAAAPETFITEIKKPTAADTERERWKRSVTQHQDGITYRFEYVDDVRTRPAEDVGGEDVGGEDVNDRNTRQRV